MLKLLLTLFSAALLTLAANQSQAANVAEYYANDAAVESLFAQAEVVDFALVEGQIAAAASFDSQNLAMDSLNPVGDDQIVAILLCWIAGGLAIHRVYLGSTPLMILWYLLTCGGICGIVPIIDFFALIIGGVDSYLDSDKFFSF